MLLRKRKSRADRKAEALRRYHFPHEMAALDKTPETSNTVVARVIGHVPASLLLTRGWTIQSHTPQSYGSWWDIYIMTIDRSALIAYMGDPNDS